MESNNKMRYISAMDVSYKDGIERPFIEIGQIVWVADNSGVKKSQNFKMVNTIRISCKSSFCSFRVRKKDPNWN